MNLKKIYQLILIIFISHSSFVFSQEFSSTSQSEFLSYISQQDQYYQNLIDQNNGSSEGIYGYKSYNRWKTKYYCEAYNDDGMQNVLSGELNFNKNYETIMQNTNSVSVEWEEFGPFEKPENVRGFPEDSYLRGSGVGRVFFVGFDPQNSNRVFIGSPTGGLFYSTDNGNTWMNGGTDQLPNPGISHFEMVPVSANNDESWFILTGDRDNSWSFSFGVFRSTNQGQTWEDVSNGISIGTYTIGKKLLLNENNPNQMIAIFNNGLYKTINALENNPANVVWTKITDPDFNENNFTDICYKPNSNYQTIYASTREGIYISNDGGDSFDALPNQTQINFLGSSNEERRINLRTTADNNNALYAHIISKDGGSHSVLYKFNAGNNQWTQKGNIIYDDNSSNCQIGYGRYQSFVVSQTDEDVMYKSRIRYIFKSVDGGVSWTALSLKKHDDMHWITFEDGDESKLWFGTDGGVYYSNDDCTTIIDKTKGLGIANLEKVGGSLELPNMFVSGSYDVGCLYYSSEETKWNYILKGDGYDGLINAKNQTAINMHAAVSGFTPYKFDQNLIAQVWGLDAQIGVNGYGHAMVKDYFDNDIIYYPGTRRVGRSIDNSVNWDAISPLANVSTDVIYRHIANTSYDRDVLYVTKVRPTGTAVLGDFAILKTNNCRDVAANVSWTDVSPTFNGEVYLEWCKDIAINGNDTDEIWAAYSGYNIDKKVLHRKNGVWYDITYDPNQTLDDISVQCIKWVNGGDNLILLGTNCGVYYKTDHMNNWTKLDGMPNVKIREMEVQPEINKFVVATYGRGLWRGSIPCITPDNDEYISQNTNWTNDDLFGGDVIVQTGARLTISDCEIQFAPGKKIIVEQGAELILDNAILDSRCSELWGGVEIWGNSNQSQSPSSNQGAVRTYSGTIIKNAVCGIRAVKYTDEPILSTAGGIVLADGTQFINNAIGISIPYYNSFSNTGLIRGCEFKITDNVSTDIGMPIGIYLVSGTNVAITDNQFLFENSKSELRLRAIGIKNFGASATINKRSIGNHFSGWNYGIYSSGLFGADHVVISDNTFEECITGVYMSGNASCEIIFNDFDIPDYETEPHFAGVYLNNCNSFTLEENVFHSNYQPLSSFTNSVGLVVNNSGPNVNEVYKNTFDKIRYAVLAQDENRASNGDGLSFKCNTFTDNGFDISAEDEGAYTGIAQYQGSNDDDIKAPAGNQFSYTGPAGTPTDINNLEQQITYYFHDDDDPLMLEPEYYINTTPSENTQTWVYDDCCPSNYGGGSGGIGIAKSMMTSSEQEVNTINTTIVSLEDGGNTPELNAEVYSSTPPETMEVYNELMGTSPYLSNDVVETAIIKEDVLPNAMIRDVMVANPQSAKNNELMDDINNRVQVMPGYMKAQILQGKSILGAMEQIKADRAYHKNINTASYKKIRNWYLSDTLNPEESYDSLLFLWSERPDIEAKFQLVSRYIQDNQIQNANTLLIAIPNQIILNEYELNEYNDMLDIFEVIVDMHENNQSINNLSNEHLSLLEDLEFNGYGKAKTYARNLRLELGLSDYTEPYLFPDENKSSEIFNYETNLLESLDEIKYLEVFPNPVKDHIILKYELESTANNFSVQISDASGKLLNSFAISDTQNQKVIDLSDWKTGVYIATLIIDGEIKDSVKFNIIK